MKDNIHIIGIGDDGREGLGAKALAVIGACDWLIGGERHLSFFPDFQGEKTAIKSNLKDLAERMKSALGSRRMAVLASGDPNFYGIAKYLTGRLGKENIQIHPAVSSMQLAFAKIKESWEDAALLSVHGRPIEAIVEPVRNAVKVGLFTDDAHTPGEIARVLTAHGLADFRAYVCENLGGAEERVSEMDLEDLPGREFSPLNVLILKRTGEVPPRRTFGIAEDEFEYRTPKRGLITKTEVRVLSLAKMALQPNDVVWDIGAGSGSVSIEAALLAPGGKVYAVEKNREDVEILGRNLAKFRVRNVVPVHGRAPEALEGLEDPDAVFLGGTGGDMEKILDRCLERLRPGGRLVANLATVENLSEACRWLKQRGLEADVSLVQVSRGAPILNLTRFEALNPVFIAAARKENPKAPA